MKPTRLLRFGGLRAAGWEMRGVGCNLTRRCNLSCAYCRIVDNSKSKARRELSVMQWQEVINKFVAHKHAHFIFTGGEPTLYKGLPKLVSWTAQRALTSMITHAGTLDEGLFASLRELDFLCFSFDTLRADRDGFQKSPVARLAFIAEQCRRWHIAPSSIVTVTAKNVDEIEPIARQLDAHGIAVQLSLIHSDPGRWDFRNHTPELEFRTERQHASLRKLSRKLLRMRREGVAIAESSYFLRNMPAYAAGRYQVDCPAADPFVTIDFDGRIKACHDTPASEVHALHWHDLAQMRRAVRATVKPGCNCYYDCYVEAGRGPVADAARLARRLPDIVARRG